jgi:hypothetical protein
MDKDRVRTAVGVNCGGVLLKCKNIDKRLFRINQRKQNIAALGTKLALSNCFILSCNRGIMLSLVILLGFADSSKIACRQVGPPEAEKPNKRYRDAQPNIGLNRG